MASNPNYSGNFIQPFNRLDDAILNGPNESFDLNEVEKELLFFNRLVSPLDHGVPVDTDYWTGSSEPYIEKTHYRKNSRGFRCDELFKTPPLVITGCSHTYGVGMHEELTWGSKLASSLEYPYINLGIPGGSVSQIVTQLLAFFKEFGHPKLVVCAFPNLERLHMPQNKHTLISKAFKKTIEDDPKAVNNHLDYKFLENSYFTSVTPPTYSKKPHLIDEVIPVELPYWLAMQSINMLEQYCEAANIRLIWGMWDFMNYDSIEMLSKKDSSYFKYKIDLEMGKWWNGNQRPDNYHRARILKNDGCVQGTSCNEVVECHLDLKGQNSNIFDIGTDFNHWGTHRHQHVFELFKQAVEG